MSTLIERIRQSEMHAARASYGPTFVAFVAAAKDYASRANVLGDDLYGTYMRPLIAACIANGTPKAEWESMVKEFCEPLNKVKNSTIKAYRSTVTNAPFAEPVRALDLNTASYADVRKAMGAARKAEREAEKEAEAIAQREREEAVKAAYPGVLEFEARARAFAESMIALLLPTDEGQAIPVATLNLALDALEGLLPNREPHAGAEPQEAPARAAA